MNERVDAVLDGKARVGARVYVRHHSQAALVGGVGDGLQHEAVEHRRLVRGRCHGDLDVIDAGIGELHDGAAGVARVVDAHEIGREQNGL